MLLSCNQVYLYSLASFSLIFLLYNWTSPLGRVKHHPLCCHQQPLCSSAIHYRGPADEGARQAGQGMLCAPNTQMFTVWLTCIVKQAYLVCLWISTLHNQMGHTPFALAAECGCLEILDMLMSPAYEMASTRPNKVRMSFLLVCILVHIVPLSFENLLSHTQSLWRAISFPFLSERWHTPAFSSWTRPLWRGGKAAGELRDPGWNQYGRRSMLTMSLLPSGFMSLVMACGYRLILCWIVTHSTFTEHWIEHWISIDEVWQTSCPKSDEYCR